MSSNYLHGIAIVAAFNTPQARCLDGETSQALLIKAVEGALARSGGLSFSDIDGVSLHSSLESFSSRDAVHLLGGRASWTGDAYIGIGGVLEAAAAIASGQCEVAVVGSAQAGLYRNRAAVSPWTKPNNEFVGCWGLFTAAEFALIARRHMHLYGTRSEQLSEVASAIRMNGAKNPEAIFYGREVTPEDVLASRMIADPFHLLDCSMNSEGGCALIMTSVERARNLDTDPVYLLGGALDRCGSAYKVPPSWDKYGRVGQRAARIAFRQSGLSPAEVDVCEFYDPFSFEIIRQFEAFGFCDEGEGGAFVENGRIRIDGELPICTDGGLMSFSHTGSAQLLQKVVSGVLQLQGRVPQALKVAGANTVMVSNGGAGALFCDVLLLGREQL